MKTTLINNLHPTYAHHSQDSKSEIVAEEHRKTPNKALVGGTFQGGTGASR